MPHQPALSAKRCKTVLPCGNAPRLICCCCRLVLEAWLQVQEFPQLGHETKVSVKFKRWVESRLFGERFVPCFHAEEGAAAPPTVR